VVSADFNEIKENSEHKNPEQRIKRVSKRPKEEVVLAYFHESRTISVCYLKILICGGIEFSWRIILMNKLYAGFEPATFGIKICRLTTELICFVESSIFCFYSFTL